MSGVMQHFIILPGDSLKLYDGLVLVIADPATGYGSMGTRMQIIVVVSVVR